MHIYVGKTHAMDNCSGSNMAALQPLQTAGVSGPCFAICLKLYVCYVYISVLTRTFMWAHHRLYGYFFWIKHGCPSAATDCWRQAEHVMSYVLNHILFMSQHSLITALIGPL